MSGIPNHQSMRWIFPVLLLPLLCPVAVFSQIDIGATPETRALFQNLIEVSRDHLLFGHQDDLAYGVDWWDVEGRSDVKEVCGDFPAVYGWDVGEIHETANIDGVDFEKMKNWIRAAYTRGGIHTISMHLDNPVTGGNAWDNTEAVSLILPGGAVHEEFLETLNQIGAFLADLRTDQGVFIPIILRPYHEPSQTWPWWGTDSCTREEYIELWTMTVRHFRDTLGLHHLLYAFSPQDVTTAAAYFDRYPGDEWVDVLGLDYYNLTRPEQADRLGHILGILGREAANRGKVSALTETGVDTVPRKDWWTECLYRAVNSNEDSRRTAWALVWRNANPTHFHAPWPGHPSTSDFVAFHQKPDVWFASDLPDMYDSPAAGRKSTSSQP